MPLPSDKLRSFVQRYRQRTQTSRTLTGTKHPSLELPRAIRAALISEMSRSPGLRSASYLGMCFTLPHIIPSPWPGGDVWSRTANYVAGAAVLGSLTWMFSVLFEENISIQNRVLFPRRLRQSALGIGLGAAAFGGVVFIGRSFGWVELPSWGWKEATAREIATTMFFLSLQHGAVACSEELVFRGYGLHTLQQAVGMPVAAGMLVTLFSFSHGTALQSLIGQGALGLALTSLRLTSGSVVLPISYHFAWNYVQTAVLGPGDWPSLRPLHIKGPYHWMGRPGHPEPGLLTTFVNLAVAASVALVWWNRQRKHQRTPKSPTVPTST